jgi:hypothetical protein
VPYEDIFIHSEDYYDTTSYGEGLIQDPFDVPLLRLLNMVTTLAKNEFNFYSPEVIKMRRRVLAQSNNKNDSTMGTHTADDILDASDNDQQQEDDSEHNGSDDCIIFKSQHRNKISDSDLDTSEDDEDVNIDELEDDEEGKGKSIPSEDEEDKNEKMKSMLGEDEAEDVDELDEYENEKTKGMLGEDEDVEMTELDEDETEKAKSILVEDELEESEYDNEKGKSLPEDSVNVDELEVNKNTKGESMNACGQNGEVHGIYLLIFLYCYFSRSGR